MPSLTRELGGPDGALLVTDGQGVYLGEYVKKGTGRSRKTFDGPWVNLFQGRLLEIARDRELTGFDFRVLLILLSRASHEDHVFDSNPTGTARALGVDVRQVTRAMKRLVDKGLVERVGTGKIALNAHFAWRGSAEARLKWLKERETL